FYELHPRRPGYTCLNSSSDCDLLNKLRRRYWSSVGYMKVRVLMLVLLVPYWLNAEQQYYRTRVPSLTLSGTESQTDLELLPIRPGDVITTDNIRSSIQALYNTGHYSYVEVDATAAADGATDLTFRVRSNFFFSTLRLEPENL